MRLVSSDGYSVGNIHQTQDLDEHAGGVESLMNQELGAISGFCPNEMHRLGQSVQRNEKSSQNDGVSRCQWAKVATTKQPEFQNTN